MGRSKFCTNLSNDVTIVLLVLTKINKIRNKAN